MLSLKEGLSELQNALPGTSQHSFDTPFFLCSSYPQTQWYSLTHSWLVLIFHFLCQVTVGDVISCSLQGVIALCSFSKISSLAIFLSTLWPWKWMFVQLAFPFWCCCFCISVELQERRRVQRARSAISQWLKGSPPVLLPKRWMKKTCKSVDKYPLETHAYLWAPKKEEQFVNMSLKTTEE